MATDCGSDGIYAKIALDATATPSFGAYSSVSPCFPLLADGSTLIQKVAHVNTAGLNGEIDEDVEHTREGWKMVEGDISLALTPETMQYFGPLVTGQAWALNISKPVTALPADFHCIIHKDAYIYEYSSLQINQAVISSSSGELVKFVLSCLGKKRNSLTAGASWPADLLPSMSVPYYYADLVISVGGTAYKTRSFTLTINKNLGPRYFESNLPCGFKRNGKQVNTLQLVMPHTATIVDAVLNGAVPPAYLAVALVFTHPNGTMAFTVNLPGWQLPPEDPTLPSGELLLTMNGTARRTPGAGSTRVESFKFTNDNI